MIEDLQGEGARTPAAACEYLLMALAMSACMSGGRKPAKSMDSCASVSDDCLEGASELLLGSVSLLAHGSGS